MDASEKVLRQHLDDGESVVASAADREILPAVATLQALLVSHLIESSAPQLRVATL